MTQKQAGFTLLEAIVALVIMAAVIVPLLSFIGQMARSLHIAAESNERSFAEQAAVALLDPVNPMVEPQGELALDNDVSVSWTSEVLVPPNSDMLMGGGLPGFKWGFYRVLVTLTRSDREGDWFTFEMRKVGYDHLQAAGAPP